MQLIKRNKLKFILSIAVLLLLTMFITTYAILGDVKAAEVAPGTTVTFKISAGKFYDWDNGSGDKITNAWHNVPYRFGNNEYSTTAKDNYQEVTLTATVNESGCLILPFQSWADLKPTYLNNDGQYYEFAYFGVNKNGVYEANGCSLWALTGFQIKGTTPANRSPGKTVFQPGDTLTPEVLAAQATDGVIELEGVWGSVIYVNATKGASDIDGFTKTNGKFVVEDKTYKYDANNDGIADNGGVATGDYEMQPSALVDSSKTMWESNFGTYPTAPLTTEYSGLREGTYGGGAMSTIEGAFAAIHKLNRTNSWRAELVNDAYSTVIILQSDAYYLQKSAQGADQFGYNYLTKQIETEGKDIAVTFKSDGDANRTIYIKPDGLSVSVNYNIRFDNINFMRFDGTDAAGYSADNDANNYFSEIIGFEWFFRNSNNLANSYVEMTSRFNKTKSDGYVIDANHKEAIHTFRIYDRDSIVINGGGYNSLETRYGDENFDAKWVDRTLKIGGTAAFKNAVTLGSTSTNGRASADETLGNWNFYMTGGFIFQINGASVNTYADCFGHRNIYILGDNTENAAYTTSRYVVQGTDSDLRNPNKYRPFVRSSVMGSSGAKVYGNINMKINRAKIEGSIYGGGYNATATVYGDVHVDINNSTIGDGNDVVYGGGYNGNVEVVPSTYVYTREQYVDANGNYTTTNTGNKDFFNYKYDLTSTGDATNYSDTNGNETATNNGINNCSNTASVNGKNRPIDGINKILGVEHKDTFSSFGTWKIGSGGKVYLKINNSTVKANVNGSSSGGSNTYTVAIRQYPSLQVITRATYESDTTKYNNEGCYIKYESGKANTGIFILPASVQTWANTKPTDFPKVSDNAVLINVKKALGWNGHSANEITWSTLNTYAELSVAQVSSVDMDILNSSVTGNIYGGGNTANVNGNVDILIDASTVTGNVFGGGNGSQPSNVTVSIPDNSTYNAPYLDGYAYHSDGLPSSVAGHDSTGGSKTISCSWTNNASLKTTGVNASTGEIYSENYGNYGNINGNVILKINNSTVNSSVYGGGNSGDVTGTVTVNVTDSKISNGASIYGGGNNASSDVAGKIKLDIINTPVAQSIYGGSQNGSVKDIDLTVGGTTSSVDVYGGSHQGTVNGQINVWFKDSANSERVYAGGYKSNYNGIPNLYVQGGYTREQLNGYDGVYGGSAYGLVGGTNVIITGGDITNVYGGGNYTGSEVKGNVYVEMSGGTADYFYGGAGYGIVTGNVEAKITGNAVVAQAGGDSVFGGGYLGDVGGDVKLTIDVDIDVPSPTSSVGIYGGGNEGNVGGNTKIIMSEQTISESDDEGAYIYGGCKNATVTGNTTLEFTDCDIYGRIYGANNKGGSVTNTNVNLTNCYVSNNVFGGGREISTGTAVTGTANVTIDCTDVSKLPATAYDSSDTSRPVTNGKTVYGGSDMSGDVANTQVILKGYAKVGDKATTDYANERIYGGGNQAIVTGSSNVNLSGNAFARGDVYGGGKSAAVLGGTSVNISGNSTVNLFLYGGGESGAVGSPDAPANTYVNISENATAISFVLGGGNLANGIVYGNTNVRISGGTVGQYNGGQYIFGGGNSAKTVGDTYVNITGGNIAGRVFGGADNADVEGAANLTVSGGTLNYDNSDPNNEIVYYGGCNTSGTVHKGTNVNITDTVKYTRIYGGGLGENTTVLGTATVTVNDPDASGLQYVFGGSRNGKVENSVVNVTGTPVQYVFGGSDGATSSTTGDITVNVSGSTVNYVYGGGNNGVVGAADKPVTVDVNITNGSILKTPSITQTDFANNSLFGGGNNADVYGNIDVTVQDSNVGTIGTNSTIDNYRTYQAAFGGGNDGDVTGNITFNIKGNSHFYGAVFGGGNNGTVTGNTTVTLNSTDVVATTSENDIPTAYSDYDIQYRLYGGGNNGNVTGLSKVNFERGYVRSDIYGGGHSASVGSVEINHTGGTSGSWLYGGGRQGDVLGNVTINVSELDVANPTRYTRLFIGGGYSGTVGGNITINATGGKFGTTDGGTNSYNDYVYCGGFEEAADVTGSITASFKNCYIGGRVYGGGYGADVGGTINLTIDSCTVPDYATATYDTVVFGGNDLKGTVTGNITVNIKNTTLPSNVFGGNDGYTGTHKHFGGSINASSENIGAVANGNITVNIEDGSVVKGSVFGASNEKGTTTGKATVNIKTGATVAQDVYGGGNVAAHDADTEVNNAGTVTGSQFGGIFGGGLGANASVKNTVVNMTAGETTRVYGGGNQGKADSTKVNVTGGSISMDAYAGGKGAVVDGASVMNFSGGSARSIYGGGEGEAATVNSATVNFSGGTVTNIYGGGYSGQVETNTNVNITGGTVTNDVAGGGYGQTATVFGNTNLDISGQNTKLGDGTTGTDFDLVCGGGYNGVVKGDVIVTTQGTQEYPVFNAAFYCGAFKGNIEGNITGNIGGGKFSQNFYGGSQSADVGIEGDTLTGEINITHTGGAHVKRLTLGGNNLSGTIYGNIIHTLKGGMFDNVYGGSNGNGEQKGDFTGTIPGAETKGSVALTITGSADAQGTVYCGDNEKGVIRGEINGLIDAPVNTGEGWGTLAGGYAADHNGKATVEVTETGSCKALHGGGNNAYVKDAVVILNGTANYVHGGGNNANVSTSYVYINGEVKQSVYGGGNNGDAGITNVVIAENGNVTLNVYGGGNKGNVDEASVTISGGRVNGNVYGAGRGDVTHTGSANILIEKQASTVLGNVYGGGENGTANATYVEIAGGNIGSLNSNGNVYGGGQGESATVYNKTEVLINTDHHFNAVEETVYIDAETKLSSGQISTTISSDNCDEFIYGNVYGGGDLGRVGEGSIISGANRANITTEGKTKVTVMNGHIKGSVFGGGRGIPAYGVDYNIRMGTVFGSTDTNIYGGYIEKNIYGGGEQSRVYAKDNGLATDVDINCLESPINQIAIGGSVFGGGDRGSGDAINASVPTTVGDVEVMVTGSTVPNEVKGGRTPIYFLSGGIYGDGNLCLASGNRTITIKDFGIGNDNENGTMLKTFYSVQRADEVYLDNSDIVLLGAIDLVEEGDETLYSINRVDDLYMTNGSTFKLDNIVKYLGGLYSDYKDYDNTNLRQFIHLGNNGTNNYESHGCIGTDLTVLTEQEVATYRNNDVKHEGDYAEHNTVCVANGLYLEIMDENGEYGPVKGLFTLELLFSNPGEGGGFVYGSIEQSTGDFICTTEMESSNSGETIYMDIIDNVGKSYNESEFSYYYWYIAGDTINYILNVKGYVGTDQTEFGDIVTIPTHTASYWYILESIVGDTDLENYITANNIDIVQTKDVKNKTNNTNSQMAVEVKISGETIGFLTYDSSSDDNKWGLYSTGAGSTVYGMQGVKEEDDRYAGQLALNKIRALEPLAEGQNNVEFVLHKAADIDAVTTEDLNIDMTVKMFDNFWLPPQNDTHTFAFDVAFTIRRINPTQSVFFEAVKSYIGVSTQSPIRINEFSAFSADFTTRYVPRTFTKDADSSMIWSVSSASALPAGTKITMVDLSGTTPSYYYYICQGNATTSVNLTAFKQMGTETAISALEIAPDFINLYNSQTTDIITERLLFVFDFEQATGWANNWTSAENTITLNHTYDANEIMNYKDENNVQKAPLTVDYEVNNDKEGVETLTIDFDQASYPDKGVAQLNISLLESEIVDTRYYEGDFGVKLELVDANGNVLSMPNGITFTVNGKTYLPGIDNNYAVVGVDAFGTYTVEMDTSMFGIHEVLKDSDTVKLRATLYSAPEASFYDSISIEKTDDAQYTVVDIHPTYHLKVNTDNTETNLIMGDGKGENILNFTLQTAVDNDTTTQVSVSAYRKDGKNSYTESVDLSKLFTNANTILPTSEGIESSYGWVLANGVQPGTYRVVFTYATRTEYVYFIVV